MVGDPSACDRQISGMRRVQNGDDIVPCGEHIKGEEILRGTTYVVAAE